MNSTKISDWMSIGANVGILIGLVLVAVQISQNTRSTRDAAYQSWVAASIELNMHATDTDVSRTLSQGHDDSANLTEDTQIQYAMWVFSFMQMVQATDYLFDQGSLDSLLWENQIQRAAGTLTLPGVRQLWDAGFKTQLTPEFVARIEATVPTGTGVDWEPERGFIPMGEPSN